MNRRESLRILTGAIGVSTWGSGFAAAVGDLVRWADVTLLDGRVLPATALEGRIVFMEAQEMFPEDVRALARFSTL